MRTFTSGNSAQISAKNTSITSLSLNGWASLFYKYLL
jgi:hypothetical protein